MSIDPTRYTWLQLSWTVFTKTLHVAVVLLAARPMAAQYFSDISSDAPYLAAANYMYERQITLGCGVSPLRFCPDQNLARAGMAAFLIRAWSIKIWGSAEAFKTQSPPSSTPYFYDVPDDRAYNPDSFFPYIQKMYELGITSGCETGPLRFCPFGTIPNVQTAIFTVRTRQLIDGNCTYNCIDNEFNDHSTTQYFYDVPSGDPYFKWIQKLGDIGGATPELPYMNCGNPGQFCLWSFTARGSKAMFVVFGALGLIPNAESVTPGYGTGVEATFQAVVSDPLSGNHIESVVLSFEGGDNAPCAVTYTQGNGALYLSTSGGGQMGPAYPGQTTVLDNGYCQVNAGQSSTYLSGLNRTLNVAMGFGVFTFPGSRNTFLFAKNKAKVKSVKKQKGNWQNAGGTNPACQVPVE